eukprot:3754110-Prymnesium_polylepis.2
MAPTCHECRGMHPHTAPLTGFCAPLADPGAARDAARAARGRIREAAWPQATAPWHRREGDARPQLRRRGGVRAVGGGVAGADGSNSTGRRRALPVARGAGEQERARRDPAGATPGRDGGRASAR